MIRVRPWEARAAERLPSGTADELRARYATGRVSMSALSLEFGVDRHVISALIGSDVHKPRSKPVPVTERFWSKVDKSGGSDACWPWTGGRHWFGYGSVTVDQRKHDGAHRVSYRLTFGEIPDGLHVLHRCDNPPCCNPAHLFLGTHADNVRDMTAKGRNRTKLTMQDDDCIRELWATGLFTRPELAKAFGVDRTRVWHITRSTTKTWAPPAKKREDRRHG